MNNINYQNPFQELQNLLNQLSNYMFQVNSIITKMNNIMNQMNSPFLNQIIPNFNEFVNNINYNSNFNLNQYQNLKIENNYKNGINVTFDFKNIDCQVSRINLVI